MQRKLATLLLICLGLALAPARAQKSKDATVADPDVHQVVFENEHVRVLKAHIAPGWKSPMHSHPPMLLISIGSARFKLTSPEGKTQIVDFYPGMVLWRDATEHSWELLAGDAQAVAVEVKSAQAAKGE
ncbi:MAG: hypothetical protein HY656_02415 [Acidobacteria bacterium]|nr:hypothetical protein [Acidobacteriota bacterium]